MDLVEFRGRFTSSPSSALTDWQGTLVFMWLLGCSQIWQALLVFGVLSGINHWVIHLDKKKNIHLDYINISVYRTITRHYNGLLFVCMYDYILAITCINATRNPVFPMRNTINTILLALKNSLCCCLSNWVDKMFLEWIFLSSLYPVLLRLQEWITSSRSAITIHSSHPASTAGDQGLGNSSACWEAPRNTHATARIWPTVPAVKCIQLKIILLGASGAGLKPAIIGWMIDRAITVQPM